MRNAVPVLLSTALGTLIAVGQSSRPQAPGQSAGPSRTQAAGGSSANFDSTVQPFLAKTCYGCHNEKLRSGQLDLTPYKTCLLYTSRCV